MTVDNEKKHHAMHKYSRIELKCATMTVKKESQVYQMHKKGRMELGRPIFTVEKKATSVHGIKRAEWSSDTQY